MAERVKIEKTSPRMERARERVRVEVDTDANAHTDALISEAMKKKWVRSNEAPQTKINLKDLRSDIPGKKRRNVWSKQPFADPFAYNDARHPAMVYRLRLLGHSEDRIAEIFQISTPTFRSWRMNFANFNRAYLEGGEEADAIVAQSVFRAAVGWQHNSEKVQILADGQVVRAAIVEKFAPNISAAKYWLNNRQGGKNGAWNEDIKIKNGAGNLVPALVVNPVYSANAAPPPMLEADTFNEVASPDQVNAAYTDDDEDED